MRNAANINPTKKDQTKAKTKKMKMLCPILNTITTKRKIVVSNGALKITLHTYFSLFCVSYSHPNLRITTSA